MSKKHTHTHLIPACVCEESWLSEGDESFAEGRRFLFTGRSRTWPESLTAFKRPSEEPRWRAQTEEEERRSPFLEEHHGSVQRTGVRLQIAEPRRFSVALVVSKEAAEF